MTDRPVNSDRILVAAISVATMSGLPVFMTGALAVQIRADLGFGEAGQGLTVAAYFAMATVTSALAGRLAEALGPAPALRLSTLLSTTSLLAIATITHSLPVLIACVALGGVANAIAHPAANLLLVRNLPPNRVGFGFGLKQAAIPVANLIGALAVPTVALTAGWRWAYAGGAVLGILVTLSQPGVGVPKPARKLVRRGRDDAAIVPLIILACGGGMLSAAGGTLGSFLVSGLVDSGWTEAAAGAVASCGAAACVATRVAAGAAADRRRLFHLRVVAAMAAIGALGFMALAFEHPPGLVFAGAMVAYGIGWGWPGLFNLAIVRNNPVAPAAATGITQSGVYAGAVAGPLVFGMVVEQAGYRMAWMGSATTALLGATAVLVGRRSLLIDRDRRELLIRQTSRLSGPT